MTGATVNKKEQFYNEGRAEDIWKEGWAYIKTVATTVREPLVILDKKLCVLAANQSFYQLFHATPADLEYWKGSVECSGVGSAF